VELTPEPTSSTQKAHKLLKFVRTTRLKLRVILWICRNYEVENVKTLEETIIIPRTWEGRQ